MSLNVFGRTLTRTAGRDHNQNHHCMVIVGKPFQEARVFQVADALEKATPFRAERPAMVSPAMIN